MFPPYLRWKTPAEPLTGINKLESEAAELIPTKVTVNKLVDLAEAQAAGGSSIITVANIAALSAYPSANVATGAQFFVETTKCLWTAVIEADPGTNGITTVRNADFGTITYYRDTAPAREFFGVTTWYVNNGIASVGWGAGNDENDGTTALTPLATIGELNRRTNGMTTADAAGGYFSVKIGPQGAGQGALILTADCDISADPADWTLVDTATGGAVTGSVALNRATNTQQSLTVAWPTITNWSRNYIYKNVADGSLTFIREGDGTHTAKTNFETAVANGGTVEAYDLPEFNGDIFANGHYVAFSGLKKGPSAFTFDSLAFSTIRDCSFPSSSAWHDCSGIEFNRCNFTASPLLYGAISPLLTDCVCRSEMHYGNRDVAIGGGYTVGTITLSVDTAVLSRFFVSSGCALQLGGFTPGLALDVASVYFGTAARLIIGKVPTGAVILYGSTGTVVDILCNVADGSYLYGTITAAAKILDVLSNNCRVTYADKNALVVTNGATVFPWQIVDPGSAVLSGNFAALPVGSAAAVPNPIGIFPRA